MKTIKLEFKDKSIISLSGRSFGVEIYNEQVANEVKGESEVILEFPPNILTIASSFANGLLSVEIEQLGGGDGRVDLKLLKKKFTIRSDVAGFQESFWESF